MSYHYTDEMVSWPSYLYNGNPYMGKMVLILKEPLGPQINRIPQHIPIKHIGANATPALMDFTGDLLW